MRRTLAVLAFTSSLLTLTAAQPNLLAPLWHFLSFLGSPSTADAGAGWDPDGLTKAVPPTQTDAGAGWDPSGLTKSDAGAGWDPNG
ncbi:MAG TPA: hypothetical protein VF173_05835 [Thermoanaerobaculia bacterium]|nr:hypothetical protein [Thermoanaerobaculia bacterium]